MKTALSQYFYNYYWLHTAQLYQETPWKQIAGSAILTKGFPLAAVWCVQDIKILQQ